MMNKYFELKMLRKAILSFFFVVFSFTGSTLFAQTTFEIWNWEDLSQVATKYAEGYRSFKVMQDIGIPNQPETFGKGTGCILPDHAGTNKIYGWYGYQGYTGNATLGDASTFNPNTGKDSCGWVMTGATPPGWKPVTLSSGSNFDGQNHFITGMWINRPAGNHQALFYAYRSASASDSIVIKNIKLILHDKGVTGLKNVAGLVNSYDTKLNISNCHVRGRVNCKDEYAGLLMGLADVIRGGTIEDCSAIGLAEGKSNKGIFIGAIGGRNTTNILRCYAKGTLIDSMTYQGFNNGSGGFIGVVGGISATINIASCYSVVDIAYTGACFIGYAMSNSITLNVSDCYAVGTGVGQGFMATCRLTPGNGKLNVKNYYALTNGSYAFLGTFDPSVATLTNCYFNTDISPDRNETEGDSRYALIKGKTTEELSTSLTSLGFDPNVWGMDPNKTYPYLLWQKNRTDIYGKPLSDDYKVQKATYRLNGGVETPYGGTFIKIPYTGNDNTVQFKVTNLTDNATQRIYSPYGADPFFTGSPSTVTFDAPAGDPTDSLMSIAYASASDIFCVRSPFATYHANGGIGADSTEFVVLGSDYTILNNIFTAPANKEFAGWNTEPDGSGAAYTPAYEITDMYKSLILYAQWNDLLSCHCFEGSGTAANPYTIATAECLAELATKVNAGMLDCFTNDGTKYNTKYYKLLNDIDLAAWLTTNGGAIGWTPIGNATNSFNGNFDGQNHTITGMWISSATANQGLFGVISGSALVKNTSLADVNINMSASNAGGIAGTMSNAIINNCHLLSGTISATGSNGALGGIVGNQGNNTIVENCSSAGSIIGVNGTCFGGLIGKVGDVNTPRSNAVITNCHSSTSITSSGNAREVGGLIGTAGGESNSTNSVAVSNCYATGNVSTNIAGSIYVGGLVGRGLSGLSVSKSYATGTVTARGQSGGFMGYASYAVTITDCFSIGVVNGGDIGTGNYGVGAFIGVTWVSSTIKNCYATGAVTIISGTDVSGFIGYVGGATQISGCYFDKGTTGRNNGIGGGSSASATITGVNHEDFIGVLQTSLSNTIWGVENRTYPYLLWQEDGIRNNTYQVVEMWHSLDNGATWKFFGDGMTIPQAGDIKMKVESNNGDRLYNIYKADGNTLNGGNIMLTAGTTTLYTLNNIAQNQKLYVGIMSENDKVYFRPVSAITLNLKVFLEGAMKSGVAEMKNTYQNANRPGNDYGFEILRLPEENPYQVKYIDLAGVKCTTINDTAAATGKVVDWVMVQILKASTPGNSQPMEVLERKALLLQTDGTVIDINGGAPAFNPQADPVYIQVVHRNHLTVVTPLQSTGLTTDLSHNFTEDLSRAFKYVASDPAPMRKVGNVYCMYLGDVDQNGFINNTDVSLVNTAALQGIYDKYNDQDVDFNGYINNTDFSKTSVNAAISPYSPLIWWLY